MALLNPLPAFPVPAYSPEGRGESIPYLLLRCLLTGTRVITHTGIVDGTV